MASYALRQEVDELRQYMKAVRADQVDADDMGGEERRLRRCASSKTRPGAIASV